MATENVTVLFTDLVGSTALSSSSAQDVADELRRGHFSVLRQAIAESGGSEVKNLGDGLMVVFGATSAALGCAVAMQQGVDAENRSRNRTVGLRVGLSVGEVSREEAPTISVIRWWRQPGCARSVRAVRSWRRMSCG